ncbi:MAG: recombinase family protein [Planctomycetota bacterium]
MIVPNTKQQDRYRGRRYICFVRQSNDDEGESSVEAQLVWMHQEGSQLGMVLVEDIKLSGVTGSIPGKRVDIAELLKRKREVDDFDVLMIQRIDRTTRGGVLHGMWFEYECARHGIEIIYPGEDLPEDEHQAIWPKVAKYEAAYEQAKSISQRSTQGWLYAFGQGRCQPFSHTPMGCDRLYLGMEGDPLFLIRNFPDGTQQKLDVQGEAVLETFAPKSRFRKQKLQKPLLVPGEASAADVVKLIFELHYIKGWGGKRVCGELNKRGIPSPTGKAWKQNMVESIYLNPAYCGVALGSRTSQGIFNRRGDGIPERIHISSLELASRTAPPRAFRPPDEWKWVDQPLMLDFLPPALRDKALPLIKQFRLEEWQRSQDPDRPKRSPNKHKDSEYVLTDLLFAKQDGGRLSGILCGKVGKKVRKYRHLNTKRGYVKGSIFNHYIRAAELESAVLTVVLETVADVPHLRQRIRSIMSQEQSASDTQRELDQLKKEREKVAQQFRRIMANMTDEDRDDIQPELNRLRARRRDLDAQIEKISGRLQYAADDPNEVADAVVARLQELPKDASGLTPMTKRELLRAFVEKVEVDMATRDAEVFLKLPPWSLSPATSDDAGGRLGPTSPQQTASETHPILSVLLGFADCRYVHDRLRRQVCYRCRRRAAA